MIDFEHDIFNTVAEALRAEYPPDADEIDRIFVTSETVPSPPFFPCVAIVQQNNATLVRTLTQSFDENHITSTWQVDAFSNKASGKKSECKKLMEVVDASFSDMGFVRTFMNPTPNAEDASIYRITARYQAVISRNGMVFRR